MSVEDMVYRGGEKHQYYRKLTVDALIQNKAAWTHQEDVCRVDDAVLYT